MKVTFDSNAWELIVFPERHPNNRDHGSMVKIKEVLRNGQIQGFICESFGTLEAILPTDRAAYLANKIPIVETSVTSLRGGSASISIRIESDHSLHPGLHERQVEKLEEALAIGMRLLSAPYFNQPLPPLFRNNPAIYAPEVFST